MKLEEIMNEIGYPESHSSFVKHGYDAKWVINPRKLAEFLQKLYEKRM